MKNMNREIKFRAWNDISNEMTYPFKPKSMAGIGLSSSEILRRYEIVMQFTGLKDMNGVEIYEGDLLNIGANEFGLIVNGKNLNVVYEVRVEGCDYILYRHDLKLNWGRLSRLEEMGWYCQVIGNIHEHPEHTKQI
jgi:hypothetical protein